MKSKLSNMSKLLLLIESALIMSWMHYLAPTDSMYCIYALCGIISVLCLYDNFSNYKDRAVSDLVLSFFVSCILSFAVVLANYDLFSPFYDIKILFGLCCSLAGGVVLFLNIILWLLCRFPIHVYTGLNHANSMKPFWVCFSIISLINLFYLFVVEYPGIISNDTITQLRQVLSGQYSNHHPYWHTIIIGFFFDLGYWLFHDLNSAIVLYSIWQILFMAGAFAYTIFTLCQLYIPKKICLFVFLLFAIMPYNITHSIYITKDVIFSGAALLFVVSLYRILRGVGEHLKLNYIVFAVSGICFCVWRSNGIISFFICFVVFFFFLLKKHRIVLYIMAGILTVSWVMTNPVLDALGVEQPDTVEALSIPVQQVARVIYDGKELSDDEYDLIDKVVDIEEVPELYVEWLSDPIKDEVRSKNNAYFEEHISDYFHLWIQLGLRYPAEYVKAWVDQTKGYWNGGYDYFIHVAGVTENNLGFEAGANNSIFAKAFRGLLRISRGLIFLDPFESIGLHVWLLFVLLFLNWRKGRLELLLSIPALAVILTLLVATPVYSQFRYAYPVFTTYPFILAVTLFQAKKANMSVE